MRNETKVRQVMEGIPRLRILIGAYFYHVCQRERTKSFQNNKIHT